MSPHRLVLLAALGLALASGGCARQFKKQEKAIQEQSIDCTTAQGDIRVLQHEKAHVAQEIALGVSAIYPSSAVIGLLTGTEKTKLQVATGEYNRMIDEKIAKIEATCGQ
jgi:hypothetical protein